jgi:hypothetical protein
VNIKEGKMAVSFRLHNELAVFMHSVRWSRRSDSLHLYLSFPYHLSYNLHFSPLFILLLLPFIVMSLRSLTSLLVPQWALIRVGYFCSTLPCMSKYTHLPPLPAWGSSLSHQFRILNQCRTCSLLIALMMEAAITSETSVNFYQTSTTSQKTVILMRYHSSH